MPGGVVIHKQLVIAGRTGRITIGPTTVYHGPALLIWILSPTRMFQNHDVGEFGR